MVGVIKKAAELVLKPVKEYTFAYICLSISLFIPQLYGMGFGRAAGDLLEGIFGNMFLCSFIAYLFLWLCFAASLIFKRLGPALAWTFTLLVWIAACTDYFLYEFFGTHVNAFILQLVNETTHAESEEFFRTYILSPRFLKIAGLFVAGIVFTAIIKLIINKLQRRNHPENLHQKGKWNSILEITGILYICASIIYPFTVYKAFTFDFVENTVYTIGKPVSRSFVYMTYNAVIQFVQESDDFEKCSLSQDGIVASREGNAPADIVVVIGESHSKYHSSLYGYPLPTNPLLEQTDGLFIFDDVISSVNATSLSFRNFMSLSSLDQNRGWYEAPLFPAVFKKAGFCVNFYSNQFVYDPAMDTYDASCGFFNHPAMQDKLFNHKNTVKYQYDGELIDAYASVRDKIEKDSNLVIFNLSGQHVQASERYPSNWNRFNESDYAQRLDLTSEQKSYVAHYDNATLYNDYVISRIISLYADRDAVIIYFPDHGDEVHDFRNHIGRSHDYESGGYKAVHCQLDIPFLIYLSPMAQNEHPELLRKIASSVHRPFMTDDLPHLLMDIAGVRCKDFDPARSLISDEFNDSRKRIPRAITSTVRVDYDQVKPLKSFPWD